MTFLTGEDFHHLNYATPPKWKSAIDAALDSVERRGTHRPLGAFARVNAIRASGESSSLQTETILAAFKPLPEPPKEIEVTGEMFNAGWNAQIGRSVGHSLPDIYRAMAAVDPSRQQQGNNSK